MPTSSTSAAQPTRPAREWTGLVVQSLIRRTGEFELSLEPRLIKAPEEGEVVIRIEAAPINPSDIGLMFGAADRAALVSHPGIDRILTRGATPSYYLRAMAERLDLPLEVGNEGAGIVVDTGPDEVSRSLLGRTVAVMAGGMYAQFRKVRAEDCLVLPDGTSAAEAASSFVNPMTALGMVTTVRQQGQNALVHTAAASSLGRMLNRICKADGIQLVNVVRSDEQAASLIADGADYVCTSTASTFRSDLQAALEKSGATIIFDAIGGGRLAGQILGEMEAIAVKRGKPYSVYGSTQRKTAYLYGSLDSGPTELKRNFGRIWTVSGWLLHDFIDEQGPEVMQGLKERVARELTTTFNSSYTATISLRDALKPERIASYCKSSTGGKYLIDPTL